MSFEYSRIPQEFPRTFLPTTFDPASPDALNQMCDELEKRNVSNVADLERWLSDESELAAGVAQEGSLRYIRMTCQTEDAEREKAYLYFVEHIEPLAKLRSFNLDQKYLGTSARKNLSQNYYHVLDRSRANKVELFRRENVELEKEEAKLAQKYQKVAGAMTAFYDGQERTMQQLARYLEEPDRKVREDTWLLGENRRQNDRNEFDDIYDQLLGLRQKIAENAGFDNYRDYVFRKKERFDYSPDHCFRYHQAVEEYIVPLLRDLDHMRERKLRVDPLRPWDLVVDPQNRPPLRPFKAASELVEGCARIFDKVHPEFGENLRKLSRLGLLDLESRKGKAPGGYQSDLPEVRFPFIFMNAVGRDQDVRTLLHESGHAFHTFELRDKDMLYHYRSEGIPLEFAEVASQTMEIIGGEHLEGTFYNAENAARSRIEHMTILVRLLAWIATIDAFQHWIYTHPGHSREEREDHWVSLRKKFGSIENWEGHESFRRSLWQRQLHLFEYPFYYIEYAIAWTGALGLWTKYMKDPQGAIDAYKNALALGGSKPLPELFQAAELPFDFGPQTFGPYAGEMRSTLLQN